MKYVPDDHKIEKKLCATKAKTNVYMLIGQVKSSQTLKSLPRKMSKMDDFSFVGVNAMLQNQHAHKKEIEKRNSTQIQTQVIPRRRYRMK